MSQAQWLIIAFVLLICLGTAGLSLPGMTTRGSITILDAGFTATSAVCVTGLTVVDTEQIFTFWGQLVILILIQCGGIAIITIASSLILSSHNRLSLEYEGMLNSTVAVASHMTFREITSSVIKFTIIIEGIGRRSYGSFGRRRTPFSRVAGTAFFMRSRPSAMRVFRCFHAILKSLRTTTASTS